MAFGGIEAKRVGTQRKEQTAQKCKAVCSQVGNPVLLVRDKSLQSAEWAAFISNYYEPCVVIGAQHSRYLLHSSSARQSRIAIHARLHFSYDPGVDFNNSCWQLQMKRLRFV